MHKKILNYLILGCFVFFLFVGVGQAKGAAVVEFCDENVIKVFKVTGYLLFIAKILVPLLIVIFGMIDLGKAVANSKDDEINKAAISIVKRFIAGFVIFMLPTILNTIFDMVKDNTKTDTSNHKTCWDCLFDPGKC